MSRALMALLLLPLAALGAEDRPDAETLIPKTKDLPGEWYRPWEIGGEARKYKSEAEWRKEHDFDVEEVGKAVEMVRSIPDADWQESVQQLRSLSPVALKAAEASCPPAQRLMIEAMVQHGTKEAVVQAILKTYEGVVDVANMEFVKIQNPKALERREPGEDPVDPGGVSNLKLGVMVYGDEYLRKHQDEIDVSGPQLDRKVADARAGYEALLRQAVREASRNLEEELLEAYSQDPPDQEKIDELTARLEGMAKAKVTVRGTRPMSGNAAYALFARTAAVADQPAVVQGVAQVRRGVAVFIIEFKAAAAYADTWEKELQKILDLLVKLAKPFDLEE